MIISESFKKALSFATFSLILIYFFGLINFEHSVLGISEPLFPITDQTKKIFDIIFWIIVGLLIIELLVAYIETKNKKLFLKKYWLEIVLLIFMPLFLGFKILKITMKVIKQIKISKTGFKLFQKFKKFKK